MKLNTSLLISALAFALTSSSATGQTTDLVSLAPGGQANGHSEAPECSADGRFVVWQTLASNFGAVDGNGTWDVILLDRESGNTEIVSRNALGQSAQALSKDPVISDSGRFIAYISNASDIIPGQGHGIYLYDRVQQTHQFASPNAGTGNPTCKSPAISGNGRFVTFTCTTPLLPADNNSREDIYRFDRATDTLELVSQDLGGVQATNHAVSSSVSANGRFVVFACWSNTWGAQYSNTGQIWRKDMQTGDLTCVSTTAAGQAGAAISTDPDISADGQWVAFATVASNLVNVAGAQQIAAKNLLSGDVQQVSVSDGGTPSNNYCYEVELSADGRFVNFRTAADNLHMGGSVSYYSIFVRDLRLGTTRKVSLSAPGSSNTGECDVGSISVTGRYAVFSSISSSLVNGDSNGLGDIFIRDRFGDSPHSYGWSPTESIGCTPHIEWTGTPSATSGSGFQIRLEDVRGNVPGILIYSKSGPAALPVLGSNLYVASPTVRTTVQFSGGVSGSCNGQFSLDFNILAASGSDPALTVGTGVWAQYWSRDVGSTSGSHLSDALAFVLGV